MKKRFKKNHGFTLIEAVVAVSISATLMMIVSVVFIRTLSDYFRNIDFLNLQQENIYDLEFVSAKVHSAKEIIPSISRLESNRFDRLFIRDTNEDMPPFVIFDVLHSENYNLIEDEGFEKNNSFWDYESGAKKEEFNNESYLGNSHAFLPENGIIKTQEFNVDTYNYYTLAFFLKTDGNLDFELKILNPDESSEIYSTQKNNVNSASWSKFAITFSSKSQNQIKLKIKNIGASNLYIDNVSIKKSSFGKPISDGISSENLSFLLPLDENTNTSFSRGFSKSLNFGPKMEYLFDEGLASTQVQDNSGNQNLGTLKNGTLIDGNNSFLGNSIIFDGENDYVDSSDPNKKSLLENHEAHTVEMWIRRINSPAPEEDKQVLFIEGNDSAGYGIYLNVDNEENANNGMLLHTVRYSGDNDDDFIYAKTSAGELDSGRWHHIAATWDANSDGIARIYIDGLLISSSTGLYNQEIGNNGEGWRLGGIGEDVDNFSDSSNVSFSGNIDNFRVYDFALSEDEIYESFTSGKKAHSSNLNFKDAKYGNGGVIEYGTKNLVSQGNFENFYSSFSNGGFTDFGISNERANFGNYSLKLDNANEGSNTNTTVNVNSSPPETSPINDDGSGFSISAYFYKDGTSLTESDIQFFINGVNQETDFEKAEKNGWYRAKLRTSYSGDINTYGIEVKDGASVFVDGVQLERGDKATTFTDRKRNQKDLKYLAQKNIYLSEGTIGFWFSPNWNGSDTNSHYFFDFEKDDDSNAISLYTDGTGNLVFDYDDQSISKDISNFIQGEFYFISAGWDTESDFMSLSVNQGENNEFSGTLDTLNPTELKDYFIVGSDNSSNNLAEGIIDEFFIKDKMLFKSKIDNLINLGNFNNEDTGNEMLFGNLGVKNFNIFNGVTLVDNYLYICDTGNNRILRYNTTKDSIVSIGGSKNSFHEESSIGANVTKYDSKCIDFSSNFDKITDGLISGDYLRVGSQSERKFEVLEVESIDYGNGRVCFVEDLPSLTITYVSSFSENFSNPSGVTYDKANDILLVSDSGNNKIKQLDFSTGKFSDFAGTGAPGFEGDGIPALQARLSLPMGIKYLDSELFLADNENYRIRKISGGNINTVAGKSEWGFSGDGSLATDSQLNGPVDIGKDDDGNIYFTDSVNSRIRKVFAEKTEVEIDENDFSYIAGNIYTIAGHNERKFSGEKGKAILSSINVPTGIFIDRGNENITLNGNINDSQTTINISDTSNLQVFDVIKIGNEKMLIKNISGNQIDVSREYAGSSLASHNTNDEIKNLSNDTIYFSDSGNHLIRKIYDSKVNFNPLYLEFNVLNEGNLKTIEYEFDDDFDIDLATLDSAEGMADDCILTADFQTITYSCPENDPDNDVKKDQNIKIGISGIEYKATAKPGKTYLIQASVYFSGNYSGLSDEMPEIYMVSGDGLLGTGDDIIETVVGNYESPENGFGGDGRSANSASVKLDNPTGLAVDQNGEIYFWDSLNARIRKVDSAGKLSTIIGNGSQGFSGALNKNPKTLAIKAIDANSMTFNNLQNYIGNSDLVQLIFETNALEESDDLQSFINIKMMSSNRRSYGGRDQTTKIGSTVSLRKIQ